ncbi:MAG TPA: hypothetical protein VE133_06610, partial [Candidatus Sulfotelmatobacter sp.]|nr:hypothetical protein [Candidatus Sulfotelmatobacter sp.]
MAEARREKSASTPQPAPVARASVPLILQLQRAIGNRAVQDFVQNPIIEPGVHGLGTSVLIHAPQIRFGAQQSAAETKETEANGIFLPPIQATVTGGQPALDAKPAPDSNKASAPKPRTESESLPSVDKAIPKESAAAEAPVGKETP